MKTAEEVLSDIDNMLLNEGYDSYRQDQSKDHEKVFDAFWSFFCDWQKTRAGEQRDEIERLRAALRRIADGGEVTCLAGNPAKWPSTIAANALNQQYGRKE